MKLLITETNLEKLKCRELIPLECCICHSTFYKPKNLVLRGLKGTREISVCGKECKNKLIGIKLSKPEKKIKITLRCNQCNKEFERRKCDYDKQNIKLNKPCFCSRKCASLNFQKINPNKKKSTQLICGWCNTIFSKFRIHKNCRSFCSRSCRAKYMTKYGCTGRSKLELWLESKLKELYPKLNITYNNREIIGLELDIYIPSLELAFEINGIYHYNPIYGVNNFTNTLYKDIKKEHSCLIKHIDLYVIDCRAFSHLNEEVDKTYLEEITKQINKKLERLDR